MQIYVHILEEFSRVEMTFCKYLLVPAHYTSKLEPCTEDFEIFKILDAWPYMRNFEFLAIHWDMYLQFSGTKTYCLFQIPAGENGLNFGFKNAIYKKDVLTSNQDISVTL